MSNQNRELNLWAGGLGVVVALFLSSRAGTESTEAIASSQWTKTAGIIEKSNCGWQGGKSNSWDLDIHYNFKNQGNECHGSRVYIDDYVGMSEADAKNYCAKYPVGAPVEVSYNSAHPDMSCLEPGFNKQVMQAVILAAVAWVAAFFLFRVPIGFFTAFYSRGYERKDPLTMLEPPSQRR